MNNVLNLLSDNKKPLVVSVSGGVDSMSLVYLLQQNNFKIVIVHFNHQKRANSLKEADLVETFARENSIPYHYYKLKTNNKENFHDQTHKLRYHYLHEVASTYKTPYIITAHHLDDLLENILMKLTRGSNLLGYSGIQPRYEKEGIVYLKPFLYKSKQEIIEYAQKENISYLEDESNESNFYMRNRYRHAVVPIMKQENENLLETVMQYNIQLSRAFDHIRKQSKKLLDKDLVIHHSTFLKQDQAIKDDLIAYLLEQYSITFNFRIIEKINSVISSDKPNQKVKLSSGYSFIKEYEKSYITQIQEKSFLKVAMQKTNDSPLSFTFFTKTPILKDMSINICYNELSFPLWVRNRKDGDAMTYYYGHKKLKKLLIDKKIPASERDNLLVVTDNNDQIIWIPNHYINKTLGDKKTLVLNITGENNE